MVHSRLLALLLLLLGCAAPRIQPAVWPEADIVVAQDSTGTFRTIGGAVASAHDGAIILVKPGVYHEQVKLDRVSGVTLLSVDPAATIIDATDCYSAIEIRTDRNRVSGFTLRNADSHGIWVRDGHQLIDHCLVVHNGERGIYLSAMAGNASAEITHCTVADNGETGIYAARDSAGTSITDCVVAFNPRGIVTDINAGLMRTEYNCLYNYSLDFDRVTPGQHNISSDPQFVDHANGNYRLKRSSPAVNATGNGVNIGCF